MKNPIIFLSLALSLGCNQKVNEKATDASGLIKVDIEFSDYSIKNGMKAAFLKYAHDEAVMLRPNGYPIVGIDSIRQTMAHRNDSSFALSWLPLKAIVAESGELGYTYGTYKMTTKESVGQGTYITIWRKSGRNWKFVLDAGNEGLGN
jgi:ketosteroid isomerase-like protein